MAGETDGMAGRTWQGEGGSRRRRQVWRCRRSSPRRWPCSAGCCGRPGRWCWLCSHCPALHGRTLCFPHPPQSPLQTEKRMECKYKAWQIMWYRVIHAVYPIFPPFIYLSWLKFSMKTLSFRVLWNKAVRGSITISSPNNFTFRCEAWFAADKLTDRIVKWLWDTIHTAVCSDLSFCTNNTQTKRVFFSILIRVVLKIQWRFEEISLNVLTMRDSRRSKRQRVLTLSSTNGILGYITISHIFIKKVLFNHSDIKTLKRI